MCSTCTGPAAAASSGGGSPPPPSSSPTSTVRNGERLRERPFPRGCASPEAVGLPKPKPALGDPSCDSAATAEAEMRCRGSRARSTAPWLPLARTWSNCIAAQSAASPTAPGPAPAGGSSRTTSPIRRYLSKGSGSSSISAAAALGWPSPPPSSSASPPPLPEPTIPPSPSPPKGCLPGPPLFGPRIISSWVVETASPSPSPAPAEEEKSEGNDEPRRLSEPDAERDELRECDEDLLDCEEADGS